MPPRTLRCPRDHSDLVHENLAGIDVDRCATCDGIWLDAPELQGAVQAASEEARQAPSPSAPVRWEPVTYLKCPHCDSMMARRNHMRVSGIIVDACPKHGTWLDAGELERIGAFIANGGEERAQNAEAALQTERAQHDRDRAKAALSNASPHPALETSTQTVLRRFRENTEYQNAFAVIRKLLREGGF